MKREWASVSMFVVGVCLAVSCDPAPKVIQGVVLSHDPVAKTLVMSDETRPGVTIDVSIEGADIGAAPEPGDTIRIACREAAKGVLALRVMNISRQDELGKQGGGGH
jgi:hypothetical protein